jgi:hypothetical protein
MFNNHENQQFFGVLLIAETGGSLIWIFYIKKLEPTVV